MPNYMTYPQALQLAEKIDQSKQDTLEAGQGISINGKVISATGSAGIDITVENDTVIFSKGEDEEEGES